METAERRLSETGPLHLATSPILKKGWAKKSNSMAAQVEWKRAIVRATARTMISENGVDNVHIRQLADRCGVAPQTLYNNFGGRDRIILSAIDELLTLQLAMARRQASLWRRNPILSVGDLTAALIEAEAYTRAVTHSLVDSSEDTPLRRLISERSIAFDVEGLEGMRRDGALHSWIEIAAVIDMLESVRFAALKRWARGGQSDVGGLRRQMISSVGACLIGIARGAAREAIERQVEDAYSDYYPKTPIEPGC
jgi:AcrR family transcriptional regulator